MEDKKIGKLRNIIKKIVKEEISSDYSMTHDEKGPADAAHGSKKDLSLHEFSLEVKRILNRLQIKVYGWEEYGKIGYKIRVVDMQMKLGWWVDTDGAIEDVSLYFLSEEPFLETEFQSVNIEYYVSFFTQVEIIVGAIETAAEVFNKKNLTS